MNKLDLTKKYKSYFTARQTPELVDIEPAQYISITGKGDPSQKPFAERIEALYSTAYTIKFFYKAREKDFVVSKLEGLWWYDEEKYKNNSMVNTAVEVPRSEWEYRLLIRMPDFVEQGDMNKAIESVVSKKKISLATEVEFFTMNEGRSAQLMHVGPFSTEKESLKQMAVFIEKNKLERNGLHHEIYLSDFRKTEANRLKTILREPVK